MTLTYLIGKQYREQKKSTGRNWLFPQNEGINETAKKVAKSSGVGQATVERAAVFAKNLDEICENTGIKRKKFYKYLYKINYIIINS